MKKILLLIAVLAVLGPLAACQPTAPQVVEVEKPVVIEKEVVKEVPVEKVVKEEVTKIVETAMPEVPKEEGIGEFVQRANRQYAAALEEVDVELAESTWHGDGRRFVSDRVGELVKEGLYRVSQWEIEVVTVYPIGDEQAIAKTIEFWTYQERDARSREVRHTGSLGPLYETYYIESVDGRWSVAHIEILENPTLTLTGLQGQVFVNGQRVTRDQEIEPGDEIITVPGSAALLLYPFDSISELIEENHLVLSDLRVEPDANQPPPRAHVEFELKGSSILNKLWKLVDAVFNFGGASARDQPPEFGEFVISIEDGKLVVRVMQGEVRLTSDGVTVVVHENEQSSAVPGYPPREPSDWSPKEKEVGCVEFEAQELGTTYQVGNIFGEAGVTITVQEFQWSSGDWTADGYAEIQDAGMAGGSGQDIWTNNVNLAFDFGGPLEALFLRFGAYGGNQNIEINGQLRNFGNFSDIDGQNIGGVEVSVNGDSDEQGVITLIGEIYSFAIGGQEFAIDEICPKPASIPKEEEAAKPPPPSEALVGPLTIWTHETLVPALVDLGEQFRDLYDVEVDVAPLPSDAYDKLLASFVAGTGPDIFSGSPNWIVGFTNIGFLSELNLGEGTEDYRTAALQALSHGGVLYGIPYVLENVALVRNRDLVPDAPDSWSEVMDLCAELQNAGDVAFCFVLPEWPPYFYPIHTAFGGYLFGIRSDGSYDMHDIGIDSEGGLAAAEWLHEMAQAGYLPADWDWNAAYDRFEAGEAAMIITGPWALERFRDVGVNYGISDLPHEYRHSQPLLSVTGFMVSAQSRNLEWARFFLTEFVGTRDGMQAIFEATGRLPAHLDVLEEIRDPDLLAFSRAGVNGLPFPAIPEMAEVWNIWNDAITLVLTQGAEPGDAFVNAADEIREVVEEAGW